VNWYNNRLLPLIRQFFLIPNRINQLMDLQLLAYADDVNLLGDSVDTIQKNTQTLIDASKEVGLEINTEKTSASASLPCRFNPGKEPPVPIF
jgi:hypothetical protein